MSQKNSHFKYKKGLIRYLLCIKPIFTYGAARENRTLMTRSYAPQTYASTNSAMAAISCEISGGARETRTLAPVARPMSLAGTPLHQLEYCSVAKIRINNYLLKLAICQLFF